MLVLSHDLAQIETWTESVRLAARRIESLIFGDKILVQQLIVNFISFALVHKRNKTIVALVALSIPCLP